MKQNPFSLDGEVALITGGGSGIGLAVSKCFAQMGAKVAINEVSASVGEQAVLEIGPQASSYDFDLTESDNIPDMVSRITDDIGAPTILINNSGIDLRKTSLDTTDEELFDILNTHVTGSFALTRAVAPVMLERKHGSVIFIVAMSPVFGLPQPMAYSAAKSAQTGLVRTLSTEFSPENVRVNAIAPGLISNDGVSPSADDSKRMDHAMERTPMERMGAAEDVGYAAAYLCSPVAKYVTGVVLPIDGGTNIGF
jgi:NAD(P)-dependent dehydrogenase (short-subunit alcohol dehydrogenase family)